jgi:hypothetical protein
VERSKEFLIGYSIMDKQTEYLLVEQSTIEKMMIQAGEEL